MAHHIDLSTLTLAKGAHHDRESGLARAILGGAA